MAQVRESDAVLLRRVLKALYPTSGVVVTPRPGGAEVVVSADGTEHRFKIDDGPSALLNLLLTGSPV